MNTTGRSAEDIPAANTPSMKGDPPSVAVIIPCWNADQWVARAIQSVLDQDYPNLEVIVIDDGSTDGSLDVIRSFGNRIRWEAGKNRGAPAARNRGLELTTADYALFLDADDYILGPFLRGLVAAAHDADMVFGPQYTCDPAGRPVPRHQFTPRDRDHGLHLWADGISPQTHSVLWKCSYLKSIGGWNTNLVRNQDLEIALRGLLGSSSIAVSRLGMSVWVQHGTTTRVSKNFSSTAALGTLRYLELHTPRLLEVLDDSGVRALGMRYFKVASWLFQVGEVRAARAALCRSREFGISCPDTPLREKVVVSLVGLEHRVRLGKLKNYLLDHLR